MKIKKDELIQALRYLEKNFDSVDVTVELNNTSESVVLSGYDKSSKATKIKMYRSDRNLFPIIVFEERLPNGQ